MFKQGILVLLLTGCAYQPEVGLSGGVRQIDGELHEVGCLDITQRLTGRQELKLEHCSDPWAGQYLLNNDKPDTSVETLTYRKWFGGNKR